MILTKAIYHEIYENRLFISPLLIMITIIGPQTLFDEINQDSTRFDEIPKIIN